ncbi:NUDIX hydrolase [Marivirga tractuosa]|nr:NUDIX hydrolase [Marivirga tractuosa]
MKALQQYGPVFEEEEIHKNKMLHLYRTKGAEAFSRENLEAHFTASAWITNPHTNEVLLIHHKKLNKWLQPGGHADGETDLEKVARKEANEETGLSNLLLVSDMPFDIDIHIIPENKGVPQHYHYDVRFAYFCSDKNDTQINHESNDFQWVNINQVEQLTKEPSLLRMVEKSKTILNGK